MKEDVSPKTLRSAILNSALILILSIFSMVLVFGETQLLHKLGYEYYGKTASFVIPSKGQYRLGEIFPMQLYINNIAHPINAVQADLGFDPDRVEVVDVGTDNSFATIFLQREIDNEGGWVRLSGGLPNPGFSGIQGEFGTVFFRGKKPGLTRISFLPSSLVLANDDSGANILKSLPTTSYLILPERISREEEELQNNLIAESDILGESTNSGQLKFYADSNILGTHTKERNVEAKKETFVDSLVNLLITINHFILEFWQKVFSIPL